MCGSLVKNICERLLPFNNFSTLCMKGLNEFVSNTGRVPAGNYLFKVSSRNTRTRCEISSKLTIKTPGQCQWHPCGVFIVIFEHVSHLMFPFVNFEHVNASWNISFKKVSQVLIFLWHFYCSRASWIRSFK